MEMTTGLIILIAFLLTCSAGVINFSFYTRRKVTTMHGMIFSMSMAMGVGLFTGTIIGLLYRDELLLATVIGMATGVLVGGVIGSFYSLLAMMEGILSGVMAGMMGAMLGVMIKISDWDKGIMVMFTIALAICCLNIYEMLSYVHHRNFIVRIFRNPLFIGIGFVLVCLLFYTQSPFIVIKNSGFHH